MTKYCYDKGSRIGPYQIMEINNPIEFQVACMCCGEQQTFSKRELCNKAQHKGCKYCSKNNKGKSYTKTNYSVHPELQAHPKIGLAWLRGNL